MANIIKTWPAFMHRRKVHKIFNSEWAMFYFTLGRGKPSQTIERLYFTHQGELLGHFDVKEIVINVGQLPRLRSLDNRDSEWQIKQGRWVAICPGPFHWLEGDPVFHDSFRGFHYFDLDAYRETPEARIAI